MRKRLNSLPPNQIKAWRLLRSEDYLAASVKAPIEDQEQKRNIKKSGKNSDVVG